MVLNFTSTKPSAKETSFLTHHGNVPSPDCLSTFGWLGAVASGSTVQFGEPLPVTPPNQPDGICPAAVSSKFSVGSLPLCAVSAALIALARAAAVPLPQ